MPRIFPPATLAVATLSCAFAAACDAPAPAPDGQLAIASRTDNLAEGHSVRYEVVVTHLASGSTHGATLAGGGPSGTSATELLPCRGGANLVEVFGSALDADGALLSEVSDSRAFFCRPGLPAQVAFRFVFRRTGGNGGFLLSINSAMAATNAGGAITGTPETLAARSSIIVEAADSVSAGLQVHSAALLDPTGGLTKVSSSQGVDAVAGLVWASAAFDVPLAGFVDPLIAEEDPLADLGDNIGGPQAPLAPRNTPVPFIGAHVVGSFPTSDWNPGARWPSAAKGEEEEEVLQALPVIHFSQVLYRPNNFIDADGLTFDPGLLGVGDGNDEGFGFDPTTASFTYGQGAGVGHASIMGVGGTDFLFFNSRGVVINRQFNTAYTQLYRGDVTQGFLSVQGAWKVIPSAVAAPTGAFGLSLIAAPTGGTDLPAVQQAYFARDPDSGEPMDLIVDAAFAGDMEREIIVLLSAADRSRYAFTFEDTGEILAGIVIETGFLEEDGIVGENVVAGEDGSVLLRSAFEARLFQTEEEEEIPQPRPAAGYMGARIFSPDFAQPGRRFAVSCTAGFDPDPVVSCPTVDGYLELQDTSIILQ